MPIPGPEKFLWVEKYRPKTLAECILPKTVRTELENIIKSGEPHNMILSGPAGTGKTTIARAICHELKSELLFIAASEDSGIDVLRTKIRQFASSSSFNDGGCKVKTVILDEGDHLQAGSTQPALRSAIEEFSSNCRFIFTCNFKDRIIAPLQSRAPVIEIRPTASDRPAMIEKFLERIIFILDNEKVVLEDDDALIALVTRCFPDFRTILGILQKYSIGGKIDSGILQAKGEISIKPLIAAITAKNIVDIRTWVMTQIDNDIDAVYHAIYEAMLELLTKDTIPPVIIQLATYRYQSAFVPDKELNLVAACLHIASLAKFKD